MSDRKVPLLMVLLAVGAGFLASTYFGARDGVGPLDAPAWLLPLFLLILFLIFLFYFFENIDVGSGLPVPQRVTAILVILAAAFGAVYTIGAENTPLLGLDLQGGVSVVLEPRATTEKELNDESLDLTVELLRARIDDIGVAEPEIGRQGNNIVVGLPGKVEDQQESLRRLQQTAELRFRPVFFDPASLAQLELTTQLQQLEAEGIDLENLDPNAVNIDEDGNIQVDPDATTDTDTDGAETEDTVPEDSAPEDSEESLGAQPTVIPASLRFQDDTTDSTDVGPSESTVVESTDESVPVGPLSDETQTEEPPLEEILPEGTEIIAPPEQGTLSPEQLAALAGCGLNEAGAAGAGLVDGLTPDDADVSDAYVLLSGEDGQRYCLGPTILTGETIEDATVTQPPGQGWIVNPTFLPDAAGIDQFNEAASVCFAGDPNICPAGIDGSRGRLAVVLDHEVISAPSINNATFRRSDIQISGAFEEVGARRLAEALRFGSLPLELEAQETRTVSASIGQDVLRSGVIAGLIGLVLVALYLLAYYRLAGLVAISGLVLSAVLLWTIVSWFGEKFELALSLAGVVGLIVSIGVSTDSNIVYFENVKDSYRSGRRVPTAVERAYESSISTIIKADIVSLIAAILLYALTVGAVRGFAFYLGLATVLDLIISWMFMRPALGWLARRAQADDNPRMLGLPLEGGAQ